MKKYLYLFIVLLLSGCGAYRDLNSQHAHNLPIQNGNIEYYRFGYGKPIVLISGYMTDVSSWNREFLARLAANHEVIVFNNRNVGGTQIQSAGYRTQDLAEDTYQLICRLHLEKPTVIGISMGGMIAQQLAVSHPDVVGHLVLINTAIAGKRSVRPSKSVEQQMLHLPSSQFKSYLVVVKLFFPPAWRLTMGTSLIFDRFQPAAYNEVNPLKVMAPQRQLILDWTKDEETARKMSSLPMPVLILNGRADQVVPPANSTILSKTVPHARIVRWPQGGHAITYQYPYGLTQRISEFIAEK